MVRGIVFSGCVDDCLCGLEVLNQIFDLGDLLSGCLSLLNQGVLDSARIAIEKSRCLGSKVIQNLKTFFADVCEILVAREIVSLRLDVAVALRRCLNPLGIGLRLLGQIGLHPRS